MSCASQDIQLIHIHIMIFTQNGIVSFKTPRLGDEIPT